MNEVCFLLDRAGRVLWSDASTSPVSLPDSRERWEAIWSRRRVLVEVAHSHPVGPLAFSREDDTTMDALVAALGKNLVFSVVAPGGMVRRRYGTRRGRREQLMDSIVQEEPWWAALLRAASGMKPK